MNGKIRIGGISTAFVGSRVILLCVLLMEHRRYRMCLSVGYSWEGVAHKTARVDNLAWHR